LDAGDPAPTNTLLRVIGCASRFLSTMRCKKNVGRVDAEIESLEYLVLELQMELDDLIERRHHIVAAKSIQGRLCNLFGWFLTLCCIIKLCVSIRNILLNQRSEIDPVERFLTLVLYDILGTHGRAHIATLAPSISMLFVGYLTFANTRSFVTQLLLSLRYFTTKVSNDTIALLVCIITSMYFAASSLMLRAYLPPSFRQELNATLGIDDRHQFQILFDKTFVFSACVSAAAIMGNRHYKNQKYRTF